MRKKRIVGALENLQGLREDYRGTNKRLRALHHKNDRIELNGDPAQITNCPCCDNIMALPNMVKGKKELHLLVKSEEKPTLEWEDNEDVFNRDEMADNCRVGCDVNHGDCW